jgi:hypothetical protein
VYALLASCYVALYLALYFDQIWELLSPQDYRQLYSRLLSSPSVFLPITVLLVKWHERWMALRLTAPATNKLKLAVSAARDVCSRFPCFLLASAFVVFLYDVHWLHFHWPDALSFCSPLLVLRVLPAPLLVCFLFSWRVWAAAIYHS